MKEARITAFHSNDTSPRQRLEHIVDEIAEAAKERINAPKNVAKGDDFASINWLQYQALTKQEVDEFIKECAIGRLGDEVRMREAGDILAFIAMAESVKRSGG